MSMPKLICVQLNELNFDVVERYVQRRELPAFRMLLETYRRVETFAEREYHELEPWIQWVSAHTGKTFSEHGIFRLGDMVNSNIEQVFEVLERRGLRVGAVSPMNSRNELKNPAYFIPDPWTMTECDHSGFSRRLTNMLRQTVNDNAQARISPRSMLTIVEAVARTIHPRRTRHIISLIARALGRPWNKALVLDQLVHMVHLYLVAQRQPDVSFVFLNAGAHIQHHYFFNSEFSGASNRNPDWYVAPDADPILEMLRAYDAMLSDYISLSTRGVRVMVATGLTQVPYDRIKFYYRLNDHSAFLRCLGCRFSRVLPRMTRDFEIVFDDRESAKGCLELLASMRMRRDGERVFSEIDDRGASLFVTLSYPNEILSTDIVDFNAGSIERFGECVSFVAIKNGMHSGKGFVFLSPGIAAPDIGKPIHVSGLFGLTLQAVA